MSIPVRLSLFYCSEAEAQAVRDEVELRCPGTIVAAFDGIDAVDGDPFDCDLAIVGSFASNRRAVLRVVAEKLRGAPIVVLFAAPENDPGLEDDYAGLALSEIHRLPYVMRRELRLRESELALRASERRYRELIDNAQEGVWVIDANGRTTFANARMAELLGCPLQELIGAPLYAFMDDEMLSLASAQLQRRRAGIADQHDFRFRRGDGGTFWALLSTTPLFDAEGRFAGATAFVSDITARKKMEQELFERERALQESEARYRTVVSNLPDMVWRANRAEIAYISDNVVDLTGFTVDDYRADRTLWRERMHPEDRSGVLAAYDRLMDSGVACDVEYRFRHRDGSWRWLHERAVIVDEEGLLQAFGVVSDVTDRRVAEEALRRSEEQFRTLVQQATEVIFSLDREGRIRSLNPAFERVTGFRIVDWIGRHFADLLQPSCVETGLQQFEKVLQGATTTLGEYHLRTASGDGAIIETTARALVIDGRVTGTVGIARDVTRRNQMEAELEKEKRLASLGHLAASVAHEFNNVLMSILPFAELLRRRAPADERIDLATRHIIQAVRRGRQVSQEILRLSRPVDPVLTVIEVQEWVIDFAREASAMLGPKYRVSIDVSVDTPLRLRGDRALVDQVATNLVLNARDAMPEGGSIVVGARRLPSDDPPLPHEPAGVPHIELFVRDSGPGIPAHLVDRVFDPLFTTKPSGTGLGLSIAHQAMMQQDGALRVRSVEGEGSTFAMVFRESREATTKEQAQNATAKRRRILLVEDDASVGEGLRALLLDEGFDVRLVVRGTEVPAAVKQFHPELVVLDVNLPDISGVEVFERLQTTDPHLPVIFSTGHADARALDEVRSRSAPSIMKPYDINELLGAMAALER